MPTFTIEFETESGPKRERYSVDSDRPVGPQLRRILDERRAQGDLIRGTHEDILEVRWNGVPIDQHLTPAQLQLDPSRPIELRMRRQERGPVLVNAALTPGAPRWPFLPLAVEQQWLAGALGALVAWIALLRVDSLVPFNGNDFFLDAVATTALGAAALLVSGIFALMRAKRMSAWRVTLLVVLGSLSGLAASYIATIGTPDRSQVLAGRALAFAVLTALGAFWHGSICNPAPWLERILALVIGGCMGGLAAALTQMPGPSDVWLLVAWFVVGGGMGASASLATAVRSSAVLEEVLFEPQPLDLLLASSTFAFDTEPSAVLSVDGSEAAALSRREARAVQLVARGESIAPAKGAPAPALRVANGERVWVGDALFRVRVFPWSGR